MAELIAGDRRTISFHVDAAMTAAAHARDPGETYPEVLATPALVAHLERACAALLRSLLEPGQLSVGVRLEVAHHDPTPVGAEVRVEAAFVRQDGALYEFAVTASDPGGLVAKGRHARAIVSRAKIEARAAARRPATTGTSLA